MTLSEAHKLASAYGLEISRQGLRSAALVYLFLSYVDGKAHYDKDGVIDFILYKLDKHPKFYRLKFHEYDASSYAILTSLLKADIKVTRYGMHTVILRKDKHNADHILRQFRKDDI